MVSNILNTVKPNSAHILDTGVRITKTQNYMILCPMIVGLLVLYLAFYVTFINGKKENNQANTSFTTLQKVALWLSGIAFLFYLIHILLLFSLLSGNKTFDFLKFLIVRITIMTITGLIFTKIPTTLSSFVQAACAIPMPLIDSILCMILFYIHTQSETEESINTVSKKTIGTKIV